MDIGFPGRTITLELLQCNNNLWEASIGLGEFNYLIKIYDILASLVVNI